MKRFAAVLLLAALFAYPCSGADDQQRSPDTTPASTADVVRPAHPLRTFFIDEKKLWTSPFKVRSRDFKWLFPFGVATTALIATDRYSIRQFPTNPNTVKRAQNISDAGAFSFVAIAGGLYLGGHLMKREHASETGLLAGAAIGHSLLINEGLKLMAGRDRPGEGSGKGAFWTGGSSFPSSHAIVAWSAASVIAHEYPGKLTQTLMYGGAAAVSVSRVIGQKHFPSDALVGSTLGWLIGRQIYRAHHDPDLPGAEWGTFVAGDEKVRTAADMGSAYVPITSWTYSAFDRLEALGYVRSAFPALRPWTRGECVRLIQEAQDEIDSGADDNVDSEATALLAALASEFAPDSRRIATGNNQAAELESVYTRVTGIGGTPLNDGYHFGQTIIDDYGRPNREGTNFITGLSGRAMAGPFVFYARGEYQHSPFAPAISPEVNLAIAAADHRDVADPSVPFAALNNVRLIEGYVGVNLHNLQVSFGKQNLWWGAGEGAPMLMGSNAEPFAMLRFNSVSPFRLPWIFKYFGPVRTEFFVGQLTGHEFVTTETGLFTSLIGRPVRPQPYIHGQKFSFKPTPNLDISFSRTNILGGPQFPLTPSRFWRSLTAQSNFFGPNDPGDNRSAMDMSYRIPGMRRWLTLYVDAFTEDQPTPLLFPERSAFRSGFYMPQIPGLHRLSVRGEATVTDIPGSILFPGYHYFNVRYLAGYTNRGNLLGTWVGRQGVGGQFWARYSLSPRNMVELTYRENHSSEDFLQGGRQRDIGGRTTVMLRPSLELSAVAQYERWNFPLLSSSAKSNFTTSIQFTWQPHLGFGSR